MVARYNIQIDDLITTVSQLKKAREIYLIPVNQLEKQAQIKNQEADKKLKECDELRKESGISAIQELVQLVAMCNKAIESLDVGEEGGAE